MQHDFWFWLPSSNGQLSINSAWNPIRSKQSEFDWSIIIWDKNYAPKMSTYSLLAKLNILNTKDRITRWNNDIDRSCVLCLNQNEDGDRLFFNCAYSRQILEEIMHKLQINFGNSFELNQILETMCQNQTSKLLFNHITNFAFTNLIWHIWCE